MDKATPSEESAELQEEAWTDTYRTALELLQGDENLRVIHISTGFYLSNGVVMKVSNARRSSNVITAFIRRQPSVPRYKISAGLEYRIHGKLTSDTFVKVPGFHYRVRKKQKTKKDEIIITKYLNTTSSKYLQKFLKNMAKEIKRFNALYMEGGLEDLEYQILMTDVEDKIINDDFPF